MSFTSKRSSHQRSDSGELVVFEAARYFSGADDIPGRRATARMSLDMTAIASQNPPTIQKQCMTREKKKKKKYKQPSSPAGRLASFLNSIFNQTNSKKKKKSKTSSDDVDDHDNTLDRRRRRRRSISHFRITTDCDSNSTFPASETTPYYAKTPAKSSYEDLKSFSCLHRNGKNIAASNGSFRYPLMKWTVDDEDRREYGKFGDVDEGEDSDSSSDLFDLPNLDYYSRGLPVYGTTNMGKIRLGAPISSAATV